MYTVYLLLKIVSQSGESFQQSHPTPERSAYIRVPKIFNNPLLVTCISLFWNETLKKVGTLIIHYKCTAPSTLFVIEQMFVAMMNGLNQQD